MWLFLDGISITVMSLPVIIQAGYDPLWFSVFLVIMVELGQITPPMGFNLFVLQSLTGESIGRVALAAASFFLRMFLAALIISVWPQIALWLPTVLSGYISRHYETRTTRASAWVVLLYKPGLDKDT